MRGERSAASARPDLGDRLDGADQRDDREDRYQKWLAAIRARDYFGAPGGDEAAAAVASCEEALARFESEALAAELDESSRDTRPGLRVVDGPND